METVVRHATHMPELQDDVPATLAHSLCHLAPASDLCRTVNAGSEAVALALAANLGGLGDDQAGTGALGVVIGHHGVGYVAWLIGTGTGHGRHDDAIGQVQLAESEGLKEWGAHVHGGSPGLRREPGPVPGSHG
ncbi:hypothetical protein FQZ97_916390 [compost metagenome]